MNHRRMSFGSRCSALIALVAFAGFAACSSTPRSGFDDTTGDGGGADGDTLSDGGNILFGDGGPDGNTTGGAGCSPDLQSVVDAMGNVTMKCPSDQGCAAGKCLPACAAAAADHGTVGCDFMVATPSFYAGQTAPCFSVFVTNDWTKDSVVTVTRDGMTYDVTTFGRIAAQGTAPASWAAVPATGVPPGKVAVLFLSADPGSPYQCPITPALSQGTAVVGTGRGKAWHISTSIPVTNYDVLPYGGAASVLPSGELLLPTSAWGTNYIAVVPQAGNRSNAFGNGPQWGQVLATTDNTTVKIVPTVALPSGTGVAAAPLGALTTYTLNAGELVQWQTAGLEMSGSVVSSDKPVAFMGGNAYLCLNSSTTTSGGCDSVHQQIPPISALGSEYAVPPYTSRRSGGAAESIPYRIVGAVDGTTLTYDPAVSGAPTTLALGQKVDFEGSGAFVIKSQDNNHPFYIGQAMTGEGVTGGSSGEGDEEFVNVVAPAQYLGSYVFFTDPSYVTTNLVFTRTKTPKGFQDVTLDCAGTLTGWTPVGAGGKYEITNVDLIRSGVKKGTCDNGPHT
ncbi:MAG: IgGFc-binding protein, partial [Polyangiaceae bacterium]